MSELQNTKLKRVLITFNNPLSHGVDDEQLRFRLNLLPTWEYCSFSYEIGTEEKTPHYHVYIRFKSGCTFKRLKEFFPACHIDFPKGTDKDCDDYVKKVGKWEDSIKSDSSYHVWHESYGIMKENYNSEDKKNFITDSNELFTAIYNSVENGEDLYTIVSNMPNAIKYLYQVEKLIKYKALKEKESKHLKDVSEIKKNDDEMKQRAKAVIENIMEGLKDA